MPLWHPWATCQKPDGVQDGGKDDFLHKMAPYYTCIVSKFLSDGFEICEIKVYTALNMIVHPMIVAPKASELMSWSIVRLACVRALTFSFKYFLL